MNDDLLPDPKWHQRLSFIKSGIRIAAGIILCFDSTWAAGILFVIAEILGIMEELV